MSEQIMHDDVGEQSKQDLDLLQTVLQVILQLEQSVPSVSVDANPVP